MAGQTIQARVSDELKAQAELLFSSMGMTTSDAIRIFLQQSVNTGGLPFQPISNLNKDTLDAMREVANKNGKDFKNTQELFVDLDI